MAKPVLYWPKLFAGSLYVGVWGDTAGYGYGFSWGYRYWPRHQHLNGGYGDGTGFGMPGRNAMRGGGDGGEYSDDKGGNDR